MNRICRLALSLVTGISAIVLAPVAHADDTVTYEVVSDGSIPEANVEYYDRSARISQRGVQLPWRGTATVADAISPTHEKGAEIRADWHQYGRWRHKYVTARIYLGGQLLCENTLDVGNASCYGSAPHRNFPGTAGG